MNVRQVSVVVNSSNSEEDIGRCLEPLGRFGEVILVDAFSSDNTVGIARSSSATVYLRPATSLAVQRNWALERVRHRWALVLNASETVTPPLLAEIEDLQESEGVDGYWIPCDGYYLGGPIRHCGWQGAKVMRLFRAGRARFDEGALGEEVVIKGTTGTLNSALESCPYRRVEQHVDAVEEQSTRGALDYLRRGGRFPVLRLVFWPIYRFLNMYGLRRGVLDGSRGFILCLLTAYQDFLTYSKAWELRQRAKVD